jgi:hypothetical protein
MRRRCSRITFTRCSPTREEELPRLPFAAKSPARECHQGAAWVARRRSFHARARASSHSMVRTRCCRRSGIRSRTRSRPGSWRAPRIGRVSRSLRRTLGRAPFRVSRPELYIDAKNTRWPAMAAEISITVPRSLEASSGHEGARERIVSAVNAAVEKARIVARKAGKFVRSLEWIFAVPHTTRASSFEKVGARNPSFAAGRERRDGRAGPEGAGRVLGGVPGGVCEDEERRAGCALS